MPELEKIFRHYRYQNILIFRYAPCKFLKDGEFLYGHFIGEPSPNDDKLPMNEKKVLFCTPGNSIYHTTFSSLEFILSDEDIKILQGFEEDAIIRGEWYHKNRSDTYLTLLTNLIIPNDICPVSEKKEIPKLIGINVMTKDVNKTEFEPYHSNPEIKF